MSTALESLVQGEIMQIKVSVATSLRACYAHSAICHARAARRPVQRVFYAQSAICYALATRLPVLRPRVVLLQTGEDDLLDMMTYLRSVPMPLRNC